MFKATKTDRQTDVKLDSLGGAVGSGIARQADRKDETDEKTQEKEKGGRHKKCSCSEIDMREKKKI